MPLDFGDHPARLGPASSLIGEVGVEPTHLVRRSPASTTRSAQSRYDALDNSGWGEYSGGQIDAPPSLAADIFASILCKA
jgi:hypothetical protein